MTRDVESTPRPALRSENSRRELFICAALVCAATALCFINAIGNDFTNWDDNLYVTENERIATLSPDSIKKFFSTFVAGNYHPLTMLSLALDFAIHGMNPNGYHATNVAIHVLNTLLVFSFFARLSRSVPTASIVALLFGIHPLHVESVSWISERKDVLYVFFYMASLLAYLQCIRTDRRRSLYYGTSIVFFIAALLSKGQAVTLPIVLFALDYLERRGAAPSRVWEKVPFLVLATLFGIVALAAQQDARAILTNLPFSLPTRLMYACSNLILYISKLVAPLNLCIVYPYPSLASWGSFSLALAESVCVGGLLGLGALGLLATLASYQGHDVHSYSITSLIGRVGYCCTRLLESIPGGGHVKSAINNRSIVFGSVFFLTNISLHLQILPVGPSRISERYTYLSSIGLFFLVGQLLDWTWHRQSVTFSRRFLLAGICVTYCGFLALTTIERNKVWENSETLWSNVLQQFPQAVTAYLNRGNHYQTRGDMQLALADFTAGLVRNPNHVALLANRCDVFNKLRRYNEAINDCGKAIARDPSVEVAYRNRGLAYARLGRFGEASNDFERAGSLQATKAQSEERR